jgi:hypothetical protein
MPWDLDDLEDDDDFAEMEPEVRDHLDSLGSTAEMHRQASVSYAPASPETSAIVFLNVEGVLYPRDCEDILGHEQVSELKRIVDASNARIVLSSPWKKDPVCEKKLLTELAGHGLAMIGATKDLSELEGREAEDGTIMSATDILCREISEWCDENDNLVDPDKWVALDYLNADLEDEDGIQHLVKTDEKKGLTPEVADIAIKTLT